VPEPSSLGAAKSGYLCSPYKNDCDEQSSSWMYRTQDSIKEQLSDPDSAEFRNQILFRSLGVNAPVVCGQVNSKNGFGGMTGYQGFVGYPGTVFLQEQLPDNAEWQKVVKRFCQ
jgi:hypothetical protein